MTRLQAKMMGQVQDSKHDDQELRASSCVLDSSAIAARAACSEDPGQGVAPCRSRLVTLLELGRGLLLQT